MFRFEKLQCFKYSPTLGCRGEDGLEVVQLGPQTVPIVIVLVVHGLTRVSPVQFGGFYAQLVLIQLGHREHFFRNCAHVAAMFADLVRALSLR